MPSQREDPSLPSTGHRGHTKASMVAAEEAERKRREGTPVTIESFMAWREVFEREAAIEARRALEEAAKTSVSAAAILNGSSMLDAITGKTRLTGRQQFEADASLATSDVGALEGVVESEGPTAAGGAGSGSLVIDESLFLTGDVEDLDLDDIDGDEGDEEGVVWKEAVGDGGDDDDESDSDYEGGESESD